MSVMIASPSDVVEQRDAIRGVINDWNFANAQSRGLILMPVGWETHAAPDLGDRAQGIINRRLLDNCDLLVGVFWTRLGTPTGAFDSGTVEEISRHVEAGKPAMVYFSDAPVAPASLKPDEYTKVQQFKAWCFDRGIVQTFSNGAEFESKFRAHLQIQLNEHPYLRGVLSHSGGKEEEPAAEMSPDAITLLLEAAADPGGHVAALSTLGGQYIQVNGKTFGEPGDARSAARWEAALDELVALQYLKPRGVKREIFQVTNSGYNRADQLRGEERNAA